VRPPAVSGRFYPGDRGELSNTVRDLLAHVEGARAEALAVVAPHAGYVYSGVTAAQVFGRVALPSVVVVVAPNHTGRASAPGGASLWPRGGFDTPLGPVPVDEAFGAALKERCRLVSDDRDAHAAEHAVEVELPFLQVAASGPLRIVPLVLAFDEWDACRELGHGLAATVRSCGEAVLLVASSDLNHYEPASIGEIKDAHALHAVSALDGEELLARCRREHISMCGRAPTAAVLAAARALGATRAEVVDYRHSGWVTGDESAVVGYGGVIIR
jgi:MEMO1 family protein